MKELGTWLWSTVASAGILAGLLAGSGWLFRGWFSAWIVQKVEHDFETRLEKLRADLRSKEHQIDALRQGALSNSATRQQLLFQKKIESVDRLWAAINDLNRYLPALQFMASIKFYAAADEVTKDPSIRKFFEQMSNISVKDDLTLPSAQAARPYLTDLAWALYSAYLAILTLAHLKIQSLRNGIDARPYIKFKAADDQLKAVLPEYASFIDEHSDASHSHLADTLRDRILHELRRTLNGEIEDQNTVRSAAAILDVAENIQRELQKNPST